MFSELEILRFIANCWASCRRNFKWVTFVWCMGHLHICSNRWSKCICLDAYIVDLLGLKICHWGVCRLLQMLYMCSLIKQAYLPKLNLKQVWTYASIVQGETMMITKLFKPFKRWRDLSLSWEQVHSLSGYLICNLCTLDFLRRQMNSGLLFARYL